MAGNCTFNHFDEESKKWTFISAKKKRDYKADGTRLLEKGSLPGMLPFLACLLGGQKMASEMER
mgnify:CR=1 FL=1